MKDRLIKEMKEWGKSLVAATLAVMLVSAFIAPVMVFGQSMEPNLKQSDVLICLKQGQLNTGDIIALTSDIPYSEEDWAKLNPIQQLRSDGTKPLVKRILGIPGDRVKIQAGQVIINGILIEEAYLDSGFTPGDLVIEEIPEGQYFVLGDNRGNSLDSRSPKLGLVDEEDVIGKAVVRVFPLNRFELFDGE